jgi:(2R)-ethylmalonyl-CoA mutase
VSGARQQIDEQRLAGVRARVDRLTESLRRRPKMLVGKPGLDGHSNGA